jgi:hypothetical protein
MIISDNILNHLSTIQPLNGSNYDSWRETIEIALALMEIDFALMTDAPKEPEKPVFHDGETTQAFATHERDFTPIRMAYDLERAKWDASNRKCLMVIKSSIKEAIRGEISHCETAKEYLKKVESQFTGSSKTYASTIIKRLVTEKYSFHSGVWEHNMASKLMTIDMGLKDEFFVHLVMSSLPKKFEGFEINYNSQPELRSSLLCVFRRRRELRMRMLILSTTWSIIRRRIFSNSFNLREVILMIIRLLLLRGKAKLPWRSRTTCLRVSVCTVSRRDTTWDIV